MDNYKKIAYYILFTLTGVALIYVVFKYLLPILLPFIISFLIVSLARPLIEKISKKTRASKFFVTVFVIFLSAAIIITAMVLALSAIAQQIGNIFESLVSNLSNENNYITALFSFFARIESKIPFLSSITNESVYSLTTEMITEGVKSLSMRLTSYVAKMVSAFPQIMVSIIVMLLSLFYFAKDYEKIGKAIVKHLPKQIGEKVPQIKNDIILVVSRYLKSYMLLMLITFAQLFAGFLILGIKNSFVLALIISFVDILPILGVGTVLVPWAVVMIIGGEGKIALGLLILFVIIYVVRQYAEPRIVSAQMEVHPLITLVAMYAGLKIAGLVGLIFAPLLAFIIKTSYNSLKKEKTVDNKKQM